MNIKRIEVTEEQAKHALARYFSSPAPAEKSMQEALQAFADELAKAEPPKIVSAIKDDPYAELKAAWERGSRIRCKDTLGSWSRWYTKNNRHWNWSSHPSEYEIHPDDTKPVPPVPVGRDMAEHGRLPVSEPVRGPDICSHPDCQVVTTHYECQSPHCIHNPGALPRFKEVPITPPAPAVECACKGAYKSTTVLHTPSRCYEPMSEPLPAVGSRQAEQLKELRQVILDAVPLPAVESQEKSLRKLALDTYIEHDGEHADCFEAVALAATAPLRAEVERLREDIEDAIVQLNMDGTTPANLGAQINRKIMQRDEFHQRTIKERDDALARVLELGERNATQKRRLVLIGKSARFTAEDMETLTETIENTFTERDALRSKLATARQNERQACVERLQKLRSKDLAVIWADGFTQKDSIEGLRAAFISAVLSGDPAPDSTPNPAAESEPEWITHDGGPCPLLDEERIETWEAKHDDGETHVFRCLKPSDCPEWETGKVKHHFIAYRVLTWKPGFGPKAKITADTQPQVALEAKDVPPGSVIRNNPPSKYVVWWAVELVTPEGVQLKGSLSTFSSLKTCGHEINRSIPLTGKWDANAWEPCSKPSITATQP